MTNTVLKVHLDESGYLGGQWFDSGGAHFVTDTKRIREAIDDSPFATIADEFVPSGDLPVVQVGKLDAQVVSADELTGPLTHDQPVTSLVGDGITVQNGRLTATEAPTYSVVEVASDYSASAGEFVWADTTGGGFPVTLPPAAADRRVAITNYYSSGNDLSLTTPDGASVDDGTPPTLSSGDGPLELISNGTDWASV